MIGPLFYVAFGMFALFVVGAIIVNNKEPRL